MEFIFRYITRFLALQKYNLNYVPEEEPTTRLLGALDHEFDKEQLNAEATCIVVRVGFWTTAHGDNAEPDIKTTR